MTSETAQPTRCLSCPPQKTLKTQPQIRPIHTAPLESNRTLFLTQRYIDALLSILLVHHTCACHRFAVLPNCLHNPCAVHLLSPANLADADECILQGDTLDLKLFSRRRTPLYTNTLEKVFFSSPSGPSTRGFGVRLPETSTRSSVTHSPLIICTPPSGFRFPRTKTKTGLCVPLSFF